MESAKAIKRFMHMQLWHDLTFKVVTFEHSAEIARELVADTAAVRSPTPAAVRPSFVRPMPSTATTRHMRVLH